MTILLILLVLVSELGSMVGKLEYPLLCVYPALSFSLNLLSINTSPTLANARIRFLSAVLFINSFP